DVLSSIDTITGAATASSIAGGQLQVSTGTDADLQLGGTALSAFGLSTATTPRGTTTPVGGLTLSFGAVGTGTATTITFGDGTGGTVKSLNDLNAKLSADNLLATIDSSGKLTITTTNDAASSAIGTVTGTAAGAGKAFENASTGGTAATGGAPIQDASALAVRANLVSQYNNILDQITSTSQDSSFNGVNLLNGDQLKLTFNETGKSTLKIQGVTFNAAGLGLSSLTAGTDFLDNSSANSVISSLDKASSTLRTEASALGSNLSIVQIRQDFSKNLINVLQTGSSNLTLADTNEEAANSQALSTRQSIAVSALALANQSQQSVLQLLR
ncbi:MAG: flagellar protein, partial [Afipia sp.]|nr:flagellar protein [Afipia sp.]